MVAILFPKRPYIYKLVSVRDAVAVQLRILVRGIRIRPVHGMSYGCHATLYYISL